MCPDYMHFNIFSKRCLWEDMNISQWKIGDRTFFSLEVHDRLLLLSISISILLPALIFATTINPATSIHQSQYWNTWISHTATATACQHAWGSTSLIILTMLIHSQFLVSRRRNPESLQQHTRYTHQSPRDNTTQFKSQYHTRQNSTKQHTLSLS